MPGSNSLGVRSQEHSTDVMRHQRGIVLSAPLTPAAPMHDARHDAIARQDIPRSRLTLWNGSMFLFHSALLAVTLGFGNRDLKVPMYKTDIDFVVDNSTSSSEWMLVPTYRESGNLSFTWLVASFFALSAFFHLLNATLLREFYLSSLSKCLSPTRYLEYTFSAAVMQVLIAYTLGVRERMLLLASAVLVGITMPFGYWTELQARPLSPDEWESPLPMRLMPWLVGHIPQVTAWLIVIVNFYDEDDGMAPTFVHVILWAEFVLFFSFGFVALYQQLMPPKQFYVGELAFQFLSLAAKGLLGGILIANVLILSSFDELYG